jgi:hypothetical protein
MEGHSSEPHFLSMHHAYNLTLVSLQEDLLPEINNSNSLT